MAMSFGLLKAQLKQEGKFNLDQIVWMLEKIESLEKQIETSSDAPSRACS